MEGREPYSGANQILCAFDKETMTRKGSHLEPVELSLGQYLFHPHVDITHVYFPENSMASIVATTADGQSCEIGVVGREGVVGLQVLMVATSSPHECMIQIANPGYKLPVSVLIEEFNRCGNAHDILLSFVNKLMVRPQWTRRDNLRMLQACKDGIRPSGT